MKTKFRPITIVFAAAVLFVFAYTPIFLFSQYVSSGLVMPFAVMATIGGITVCLLGGVLAIVRWALLIEIDTATRSITFKYLFEGRMQYSFDDVVGFRYESLTAKINYKSIIFKTADGKTFGVSEFETENITSLESFAVANFSLRIGKEFRNVNDGEAFELMLWSKEFDLSQYKIMMSIWIVLEILAVIAIFLFMYRPGTPDGLRQASQYILIGSCVISMGIVAMKIRNAIDRIKEMKTQIELFKRVGKAGEEDF